MTTAAAIARHYQESHGDVWVFRDDTRAVVTDKVSAILVSPGDVTVGEVPLGMPGGIFGCFDGSGGAPFRDVDLRDLAVRLTTATTDPRGFVRANGTRFDVERVRALVAVLLRAGVVHVRATVNTLGALVMVVPDVATVSLMRAGQGGPIQQGAAEVLDVEPSEVAQCDQQRGEEGGGRIYSGDEALRLLDGATSGRWWFDTRTGTVVSSRASGDRVVCSLAGQRLNETDNADGQLIAAARNLVTSVAHHAERADVAEAKVAAQREIIAGRATPPDDSSTGACPDCGDVFAGGFEDPTMYCAAHRPAPAEHVAEAVDAGPAHRGAPLVLVRIERTQVIYAAMPPSEVHETGSVVIDTDTARNWCDKEYDDTIVAYVADRKPPTVWMDSIPYGEDSSDDTIAQRLAAGTLVLWSER